MILKFARFIKLYNNIAETNPYTFNSLCCGNFGQKKNYFTKENNDSFIGSIKILVRSLFRYTSTTPERF